jgi:hypothetical protein
MSDARGVLAQVKFWQDEHRQMFLNSLHENAGLLHEEQIPLATPLQIQMHNSAVIRWHLYQTYWTEHKKYLDEYGFKFFYEHCCYPDSTQMNWAYEDAYFNEIETEELRELEEIKTKEWNLYIREEHERERERGIDAEWKKRDAMFKREDKKALKKAEKEAAKQAAQALLLLGKHYELSCKFITNTITKYR